MSCNYYIKCKCCNQIKLHLGKEWNNREFLSNLTRQDLVNRIANIKDNEYIQDDYGKEIFSFEFFQKIPSNFKLVKGRFS